MSARPTSADHQWLWLYFLILLPEGDYDLRNGEFKSAGIWAINGYSATDFAIQTMKEMKLDLDGHHSQPVTESLLEENKLILCMEKEQVTFLKFNFSNHDGKVFLLSEMAGEENDILDPVGYSLQAYKTTANKILNYLEKGLQNILKVTEK